VLCCSLAEAVVALQHCRAHLRPGGTLRLAVPDPNWDLRAALTEKQQATGAPEEAPLFSRRLQTAPVCPAAINRGDGIPGIPALAPTSVDAARVQALHRDLFARDARAQHCVQYTALHLLGLARSVFPHATLVEHTDDSGLFHGFEGVYADGTDVLEFGFIQRSSFGDQRDRARSIVLDLHN
jgi:predicted SAM-dependent methyltransferase